MVNGDYPRDWRARREEVFNRDGYTCQSCERKGEGRGEAELIAFHLVPQDRGGSHDTMNLVTVCRQCKHEFTGETASDDPDRDVQVAAIDDLQQLRRAVTQIDKLESLVGEYAKQVLGEGDVDEGEIVRNPDRFRIDVRDVKQYILTVRFMFTNLHLESKLGSQPTEQLADAVLGLLRYEHEIMNHFLDYVDLLTTVKCPKCGYDADRDSKLCGECSRELPVHWECLQCWTNVDKLEDDYCESCGNELPELPPEQRAELEAVQDAMQETVTAWRSQLEDVIGIVENDLRQAEQTH